MVIRENLGSVLVASTQGIGADYSPLVAEVMAILCGMIFAKESGL